VDGGECALENVVSRPAEGWTNRSVFLTGHTGFKGSWLTVMLDRLGARIHGYALDPDPGHTMFSAADIAPLLSADTRADIADLGHLRAAMTAAQPALVLHLAAQPLVRESYSDPLGTFATNVMGTAHVVEAARSVPTIRAVIVITTDKVYANDGAGVPFSEGDALGGDDPYSASKAAAELVTASYRRSFFSAPDTARVASARAGNVIGGGDWATDRLVPDCMRAFANGQSVHLRYPHASRPWQHVIEPLSGYLKLAEHLLRPRAEPVACAWNFGPPASDQASVGHVAEEVARLWGDAATVEVDAGTSHLHEAGLLALDSRRAAETLGWSPRWPLERALRETVAWQREWLAGGNMLTFTREQIEAYYGTDAP
jgi:CDP-glucose 4,6-dehydratase